MSEQQAVGEISEKMREYLRLYTRALFENITAGKPIDYDALGFWTFPMLQIAGQVDGVLTSMTGPATGTSVKVRDEAIFNQMAVDLYTQYCNEGWGGGPVEVENVEVTMVSPTTAIADVVGVRYRPDRTEFNRYQACYFLHHTARGWKQFAVMDVTPPRPRADEWAAWLGSFRGTSEA